MLADHQSYSEIYGTTNNPWDLTRTPGGSSGGSAAALAAGLTALDAGSDIGGSIRNPAHFCGVVGLKPTWGVVATKGQALPGSFAYSDISAIGPLARNADDLELALDAMAGPDEIDSIAWKVDLPACPARSLRDFRVCIKFDDPHSEVDAEYVDKLHAFADHLAKTGRNNQGSRAEGRHRAPPRDLHSAAARRYVGTHAPSGIERWRKAAETNRAGAADRYLGLMVRGNTLSHRDWLQLNNERHALRRTFAAFFDDCDILLCPAGVSAATPHNQNGDRWERRMTVNGKSVASTANLFWAGYSSVVYLPST